jgi:hypothetical protein
MADNPINYNIGSGQPVGLEDFTQGAALGQGLRMGNEAAKTAQQARGLEAQKQAAQQAMMAELAAESRRPGGPNSENVAALMVRYPQMAENLKRSMDVLQPTEKRERLGQLSTVIAAAKSGNVNLAIDKLKEYAAAYRTKGRKVDAQALEDNARLLEESPEDTMFTLESALAANDPEQYLKTVQGLGTLGSDVAKAASEAVKTEQEANIKREELRNLPAKMAAENRLTKAQADGIYMKAKNDAGVLGLGWAQLAETRAKNVAELQQKAGELPPAVFKVVDEAYGKAQVATVSADQAEQLAKDYETTNPDDGWNAAMSEKWKSFNGSQDEVTALRTRYEQIKNGNIIQNLPPGVASDRDIEMFSKGFPSANADAKQVAGFLRGMAKASRLTAATATADAEWTAFNKSKAPARAPMVIQGIQVQPGTSYSDFIGAVVAKEQRRNGGRAAAAAAPGIAQLDSELQ